MPLAEASRTLRLCALLLTPARVQPGSATNAGSMNSSDFEDEANGSSSPPPPERPLQSTPASGHTAGFPAHCKAESPQSCYENVHRCQIGGAAEAAEEGKGPLTAHGTRRASASANANANAAPRASLLLKAIEEDAVASAEDGSTDFGAYHLDLKRRLELPLTLPQGVDAWETFAPSLLLSGANAVAQGEEKGRERRGGERRRAREGRGGSGGRTGRPGEEGEFRCVGAALPPARLDRPAMRAGDAATGRRGVPQDGEAGSFHPALAIGTPPPSSSSRGEGGGWQMSLVDRWLSTGVLEPAEEAASRR